MIAQKINQLLIEAIIPPNVKKELDIMDKTATGLECDGFTRAAGYILDKYKIRHTAFSGGVKWGKKAFEPHFWIVVDNQLIDYRLRMWFGTGAPHGIFPVTQSYNKKDPLSYEFTNKKLNVYYIGRPVNVKINDIMFKMLTMGF